MVRSKSRGSSSSSSGIPSVSASRRVASDVAKATTSRSSAAAINAPIRRVANTAVLPVPSPRVIPERTSVTAASAACCLK